MNDTYELSSTTTQPAGGAALHTAFSLGAVVRAEKEQGVLCESLGFERIHDHTQGVV
jgi:hypothetical protein